MNDRMMMRRILYVVILLLGMGTASGYAQGRQKVTVELKNATLRQVFRSIEKQTTYRFSYRNAIIDDKHDITISKRGVNVTAVLDEALRDKGLAYTIVSERSIVITDKKAVEGSNPKRVTGTVMMANGEPIIGATVAVSGTTIGAITDINGNFSLEVPGDARLTISYIGFLSQEVSVAGKSSLEIVLQEDAEMLDEVVVVGYGTQKKVTLTGAVSSVRSGDLVTTKNENTQNMLTGKIAGVRVMQKSAEPGSFNNNFDIRGLGNALVIIDGVPRDNMTRLSPNDIESISVLKDASAAVYGVRAANGVVLITTKKGTEGHVELEYSGNVGWQNPSGSVKSVSAADWMTLKNEKSMHNVNGGSLVYPLEEIEAYRRGEKTGTDWYDAVMRPLAPQTQHTLSARGGNEKMKYYLSAGYLYQESFLRSESLDYDRFNLRSNVTANLTDRLTVDFNMSGIMDQKDQPYTNADWIIRAMQRAPATQPIYANNNPEYLMYGWIEGDNPVAMMDADQVGHKTYNNKWFQSSVQATYDLPWIEGLQLKGMFSYDY